MGDYKLETNYLCSCAPTRGIMGVWVLGGREFCAVTH